MSKNPVALYKDGHAARDLPAENEETDRLMGKGNRGTRSTVLDEESPEYKEYRENITQAW